MPQFEATTAEEESVGLDDFTSSYIMAVYWTDTGDDGQAPSNARLDASFREAIISDCAQFQAQHFNLLAEYYACGANHDEWQAAHDFWLTRNGHGAGFWDRDLPGDLGERLTAACKAFGEVTVCGERTAELSNDWVLYCL